MKSKFKYLFLVGALALALTACGEDKVEEDPAAPPVVEDQVEEEDKDEVKEKKKVVINHFYVLEDSDKPEPEEYTYYYTDNEGSSGYIVLTAEMDLENVQLIALDYEDDLVEKEVIETFDIKEGERLLVNAIFPEGVPVMKLKWEYDGKEDEYIFQYYDQEDKEYVEYLY